MNNAQDLNELHLVALLRGGDERAFRQLFDRYHQEIYAYSIGLLKSKDYAQENVQDVFLKVWLHRETLDPDKSFKSFLYTIARNQAFNILHKASNDETMKQAIFFESQTSVDHSDYTVREAECKKLKKQAIKQLPPKRQKIFKMSRKGKTYEEIGSELGISVHTVRNQMSKALESMRLFFQVHDGFT